MSNYTSTHTKLLCFLNELTANSNNTPACVCQSSTYLLTIQNMKLWKTNLMLSHTNGIMRSDDQDIKCGIFRGDLSSPFFCLAPIRFYCPLYLKKTSTDIKSKIKPSITFFKWMTWSYMEGMMKNSKVYCSG